MALFNRERRTDDETIERDREVLDERPADRHRYARGVTRGLFTLVGAASAIFLAWLAAEIYAPDGDVSDFWVAMGLIAGAGLALGLSQLFGGWTKWGVPRVSSGVLLFGWIPTAIVTGWILLTMQPESGWQQGRLESWSDSIGLLGFVNNFDGWLTVIPALTLGLVTAFIFDTTGPRPKVDVVEENRRVPDEDVHHYRREEADDPVTTTRTDEPVAAGRSSTTGTEETVVTRPSEGRRDTP